MIRKRISKERRKYTRENLYYLVKYKDKTGKKGIVSSVNISAGGVLLRLKDELKIGEVIEISINFLNHRDRVISLEAKVIWIKKYKNYYKTAVEFQKMIMQDRAAINAFINSIFKK